MIELEIDGKKVSVEEGTTIIEAADELGIYIPRFCYHKKLSIAANCRMCIVDVEKVGKPQPACATPVTPGMKVSTKSKKTIDSQRMVMEFLLINHPLDCPICDQGGECELQDLTMGFARPYSKYTEGKRAVYSENIGPLIETEMTRCIQCTRCVRFGEEIAGLRELGIIHRGEKEEISTYVKHIMQSELSGNIIDLCPVGALTDKPARYKGRGWEYREHPFISPHDCVGTNIFLHSRWQEYAPQRVVARAVPRENEAINETWMSDRDRYSHFGLYHESRLYHPKIKKNQQWETVSWEEALHAVVDRLQTIIHHQGPEKIGAVASANATTEEYYLLQKVMRGLGSDNIDHRIRWQAVSDQTSMPAFPSWGMPLTDIDNLDAVLLIGSNVRQEQPLISHRINQAYVEGAKIIAINPMDYAFIFELDKKIIVPPTQLVSTLLQVAKALSADRSDSYPLFAHVIVSDAAKAIANTLKATNKKAIFLGEHALQHAQAAQIRAAAQFIAELSGASFGILTDGANSAGAWLAGALPHRGPAGEKREHVGLDAKAMLSTNPLKAYIVMNVEPEFDCAYPADALKALKQADCVVCLTPYVTDQMELYADILLPITPFAETGGTYVNGEGRWQSFAPVSTPPAEAQPAWKVLRLLGNLFGFADFEYKTVKQVYHELKKLMETLSANTTATTKFTVSPVDDASDQLTRLAPWPMYRVDNIVRRSPPLQALIPENIASLAINSATAAKLNLQSCQRVVASQEGSRVTLPLLIDDRLADNTVYLPAGLEETAGFGQVGATIALERASE